MASAQEAYTTHEVTSLTGVPYGTLNYWARIGLVKPSILPAQGRGSRRKYNFDDLVALYIALRLREAGLFGTALLDVFAEFRRQRFKRIQLAIGWSPRGRAVINPNAASGHHDQLMLTFECEFSAAAEEVRNAIALAAKKKPAQSTINAFGTSARRGA